MSLSRRDVKQATDVNHSGISRMFSGHKVLFHPFCYEWLDRETDLERSGKELDYFQYELRACSPLDEGRRLDLKGQTESNDCNAGGK